MLEYPDPPLSDGSVGLRRWELSDLPLVEEAAADPILLQKTTLPTPYKRDAGIAFIERQWSRQEIGEGLSLVITRDAEPVGCVTLMMRRPPIADLGYWLLARTRGARVGGKAVALLVRWALARPEVSAVEAFVADGNVASQKLLERLGFVDVGRRRHQVNDLDQQLRVYRADAPGC